MSFFDGIAVAPPIEVFHMNKMYMDEKDPNKVNLTVGAYRTEEGKPWVLPVVRQAEKEIAADESLNHEYLPVLGMEAFTEAACKLVLGEKSPAITSGRYFGTQCLSGTGSLRAGAEFLARCLSYKTVLLSNPTWGNHKLVFKNAGFANIGAYTYWDTANRRVDIDNLLRDLENAPEKSVIVLHGCAHNPTGMDPTHDQWKKICEVIKQRDAIYGIIRAQRAKFPKWYLHRDPRNTVCIHHSYSNGPWRVYMNPSVALASSKSKLTALLSFCLGPTENRFYTDRAQALLNIGDELKFRGFFKRRHLFPFFDIAYQGFASGNPDEDAWAIRLFVDEGLEMFIAQSFAKNFGLYNERIGNLCAVVKDQSVMPGYKSQMSLIIRANWSNPPCHGARIVHKVLTTPALRSQWDEAIKTMSSRIKQMRSLLQGHLERLQTPGSWSHITQQIGMFSYTGLNAAQVDHLVKKYKVFLLKDGRISVCGLTTKNVEYVAKAIDDAVRNVSSNL